MANASTWEDLSPGLVKGVARAPRAPEGRCHALAHRIDGPALARASRRQRADAAGGVAGVTKAPYGQELEAHRQELHARLQAQRYRHQPIRCVPIPKGQGKTRPIGMAAFADKVVQDAVREVLAAIDEPACLRCSSGFRPGRSAHDAVRRLDQIVHRGEVGWILEADLVSFFDRVERTALKKMLEVRAADGLLLGLIGKCVHVGVLDGEECAEPERGTTPGSVLSPLLGNVYLPWVLALWFETEVQPRLGAKATLIRYGDDCHTIFNFFSRRVNTAKHPHCPRCGRPELERQGSRFAVAKGRQEAEGDDNMPDMDASRLERAMQALSSAAAGLDEHDPRQAARLMRKLSEAMGTHLGSRCPFRKSCARALPPGSATLERGAPRENPRTGQEFMKQTSSMEEVIRRMEAGEAPEQIAAAMGDLLKAEAPLCGVETKQGGKPVRPSSPRPQVDPTLYEL